MLYKYPRTFHLPWSEGYTSDDKVLTTVDHFMGRRVVKWVRKNHVNTTTHWQHSKVILNELEETNEKY